MILITQQDYDYHETVGIFLSMEVAYEYFRKNNMKPQLYDWEETTNNPTVLKHVSAETWCYYDDCSKGNFEIMKRDMFDREHCEEHYPIIAQEDAERKRQTKISQTKWEDGKEEREAKIRKEGAEFWKNIPMSGSFLQSGSNLDDY